MNINMIKSGEAMPANHGAGMSPLPHYTHIHTDRLLLFPVPGRKWLRLHFLSEELSQWYMSLTVGGRK